MRINVLLALPIAPAAWPRIAEEIAHRSMENQVQAWELRQGRISPREIATTARFHESGFPLAVLNNALIGLEPDADSGHVFTLGSTRAGKGLAATAALLSWMPLLSWLIRKASNCSGSELGAMKTSGRSIASPGTA
ncbi:MAG: hypothetical protein IIA89_12235 [Chloroflexi bacterium]|nr:hypothetical protein [Chloroflexota bacterium]